MLDLRQGKEGGSFSLLGGSSSSKNGSKNGSIKGGGSAKGGSAKGGGSSRNGSTSKKGKGEGLPSPASSKRVASARQEGGPSPASTALRTTSRPASPRPHPHQPQAYWDTAPPPPPPGPPPPPPTPPPRLVLTPPPAGVTRPDAQGWLCLVPAARRPLRRVPYTVAPPCRWLWCVVSMKRLRCYSRREDCPNPTP